MLVVSASDSLKNGKLRQIWFALRVNTDSHRMRQLEVWGLHNNLTDTLVRPGVTVPFV